MQIKNKKIIFKHSIYLLISMFLFSLFSLVKMLKVDLPILLIILNLSAYLSLVIFFPKKKLPFLKECFIASIILTIDILVLFAAYNNTKVAIVSTLHYTAPIIISLVAPFILKEEKFKRSSMVLSIIGFIGVICIVFEEFSQGQGNKIGLILAIISGFTLAANIIMAKILVNKEQKNYIALIRQYNLNMSILSILIFFLWQSFDPEIIKKFNAISLKSIFIMILAGVIIKAFASCVFMSSIRFLNTQTVSKLSYTEVFWVVIISLLVYEDKLSLLQIVGGIIILATAYLTIKLENQTENKKEL